MYVLPVAAEDRFLPAAQCGDSHRIPLFRFSSSYQGWFGLLSLPTTTFYRLDSSW
jgi:hypothetical protein